MYYVRFTPLICTLYFIVRFNISRHLYEQAVLHSKDNLQISQLVFGEPNYIRGTHGSLRDTGGFEGNFGGVSGVVKNFVLGRGTGEFCSSLFRFTSMAAAFNGGTTASCAESARRIGKKSSPRKRKKSSSDNCIRFALAVPSARSTNLKVWL